MNDHEERIRDLELKQAEYGIIIPQLTEAMKGLTEAVNALNTYVSTAKIGWKVMLGVGAAIAGLIEAMRALWPHT